MRERGLLEKVLARLIERETTNPNSEARNKLQFRNSKDFKQRHIYKKGLRGIIYPVIDLDQVLRKIWRLRSD